jgi:hypothetical protein
MYVFFLSRMMSPDTCTLLSKIGKSFDEYFEQIPDDRLLAMSVNPFLASVGFEDISGLLDDDGIELKNRAMRLLQKYVTSVLAARHKVSNRERVSKKGKSDEPGESMLVFFTFHCFGS